MNGRIFLSVLVALAMTACGPGDENNDDPNIKTDDSNTPNNTNNTNNNNNNNNNTNNTNSATNSSAYWPECDDLECPSGRRCVRGVCVPDDSSVGCEAPEDIGELVSDMMYAGTGDNTGYVDGFSTMCAEELEGLYSGAEYVMSFSVPAPGSVRFDIVGGDATFEWVAEMRQDCTDPGEAAAPNNDPPGMMVGRTSECSTGPVLSFPVVPDIEYFLLIEPFSSIDFGTFDWEMVFTADEEEICEVGRTCAGDDVVVCDGFVEDTFACGTGCTDNACAGDTCDSAIEVTAAMSFSGDMGGFTNTLDFENATNCNEDPMSTEGTETPGEEIVFRLPGLTAGQLVSVDTSMDDHANQVFVLDTCTDSGTCLAADGSDLLQWTVETDGDYFVVIDKSRDGQLEPFNVAIDIQ